MKKIALTLIIVAVSVMASGDVLAQRGGGRGGGRSGGGGARMNRSANMNRSMQARPVPGRSLEGRFSGQPSITPHREQQGFQREQRSQVLGGVRPDGTGRITPEKKESMQEWIGRRGDAKHPGYRPDQRPDYAHRHPYHHHHRYYPGWRPAWWTLPVAWGAGAAWWNWNTPDTYVYYNPYATYIQDPVYNYTEPVYSYGDETASNQEGPFSSTEGGMPTETTDQGAGSASEQLAMRYFETSRNAFKDADYTKALEDVNQAINRLPNDAALHEFRALALFAIGKYNQAAAVINSVLASGPGWNWDTMIGLYQDPEQYTKQLRDLEAFVKQHEKDPAAKFLLAYQYLVMGFTDNAAAELRDVVQIQPKDVLSKRLLDMIEASKQQDKTTPSAPPTPGE